MREIKKISEQIREELHDAEKYARCYVHHKEDNRELAEMYSYLANEEMDHAERLHRHAVEMIRKYQGAVPVAMKAVWDWEHEHMVEEEREIRRMLE